MAAAAASVAAVERLLLVAQAAWARTAAVVADSEARGVGLAGRSEVPM
jgi:hypothetical protein